MTDLAAVKCAAKWKETHDGDLCGILRERDSIFELDRFLPLGHPRTQSAHNSICTDDFHSVAAADSKVTAQNLKPNLSQTFL